MLDKGLAPTHPTIHTMHGGVQCRSPMSMWRSGSAVGGGRHHVGRSFRLNFSFPHHWFAPPPSVRYPEREPPDGPNTDLGLLPTQKRRLTARSGLLHPTWHRSHSREAHTFRSAACVEGFQVRLPSWACFPSTCRPAA